MTLMYNFGNYTLYPLLRSKTQLLFDFTTTFWVVYFMTQKIKMTKRTYNKLKKELDLRVNVERPKLAKEVSAAADFGDLPENAAWDSTLENERFNEVRIKTLVETLENAEIVDPDMGQDRADINDLVTLRINGKTSKFQLVSGDLKEDKSQVSIDSPIGREVYGKKIGFLKWVKTPSKNIRIELLAIKKQ